MSSTRRNRSRRNRDLVSIRRPRWKGDRATSVRFERAWPRGNERARDRRTACDRRGKESWVARLKRFCGLLHLARAGLEAGELFQERQRNLADRAIALFGNDPFG